MNDRFPAPIECDRYVVVEMHTTSALYVFAHLITYVISISCVAAVAFLIRPFFTRSLRRSYSSVSQEETHGQV